jgi:hypothetical protein
MALPPNYLFATQKDHIGHDFGESTLTTPPAMKSVSIGTQTVRYVEGGSPGATRTLLLFNGIGASVETATPLIASFKRTRVIAFDIPGVGESPTPLLPYRLSHVAQLAARLLDHLGVDVPTCSACPGEVLRRRSSRSAMPRGAARSRWRRPAPGS